MSRNSRNARATLRLESLETRALLSSVPPGFAVPSHLANRTGSVVSPHATPGPNGYSPAQVRAAYGFDQVTFDGRGTTIAIVDAYNDPNIAGDLHQFDQEFGLPDPPSFTRVSQTGSTTALPAADPGWITEIALDVEWAHAIAPGADILLVEANDSSLGNLLTAVDYARNSAGVVAVSMSWGAGEFSIENLYDTYFTTPGGHTGVTFLASSGDYGAPVSYPAASPNVVSVGGTSLSLSGQDYSSESGWSGSGGGISAYENQPAYQNGVVTQSTTRRTNPDVAYDSSPSTGFPVYDSYNNGTSTPWGQWGGTSAAAPQWAGLIAIADQGRLLAGKGPLDGPSETLPALYSLPSGDFHDITTGNSTGTPPYSAGPGYDLVTGRGTPYANLVINDLVGPPSTPPTTATHFSITGAPSSSTAGAPFSITVSALDSSGNLVADYVGTVHFTSSDAQALLPGDYTFTSGTGNDNGTHTFTGVTLKTAGSQTITATDTSTGTINGSSSAVNVTPASADHLAFGQQPTNVTAGSRISPAITVRVLDAYGNLVTSDNTTHVQIVIGSNPGGGTLVGTTTVTVTGGIATFSNLSIDQAGNGYTLVASSDSPSGSVTSASFNVARKRGKK